MNRKMNILYDVPQIAVLLAVPASLLRRVIVANGQPACWEWRWHWSGPRWPESALTEWALTIAEIDPEKLPPDPGRLQHPGRVFGIEGPTDAELEIAARMLGKGSKRSRVCAGEM
jgi:hypothetical protein